MYAYNSLSLSAHARSIKECKWKAGDMGCDCASVHWLWALNYGVIVAFVGFSCRGLSLLPIQSPLHFVVDPPRFTEIYVQTYFYTFVAKINR